LGSTSRKRAEQRLALLSFALNNVREAAFLIDEQARFHYVNEEACRVLGYSRDELLGMGVKDVDPDWPADRWSEHWKTLKSQGALLLEGRHKTKEGGIFPVEIGANFIEYDGRSFNLALVRDITGRKHNEEELKRLNRELRALSDCNLALMRGEDEITLLTDICTIICDKAGYTLAWVGYAEHDPDKTIRPVAWAGFGSDYIENAKLSWSADLPHGQGPAGRTIRSGETICVQDFEVDRLMTPWREAALTHGYHSGLALPLKGDDGQPFGALLIYSERKNAITDSELRLMEELVGDLAFGIRALRIRAENRRSEAALRQRERYSQSLLRLSRSLEQSQNYGQVLKAAQEEVATILDFHFLAIYLLSDDGTTFQALTFGGAIEKGIQAVSATLPIAGDPLLEEIAQSCDIVVVDDARCDPRTNKAIVNALQLRTLINVPIFLSEQHLGTISTGSVGDEGLHILTPPEREYLTAMASHIAVTLDRIQLLDERRQVEAQLRSYKDHLEQTVQQRTAELLLARDAAQAASKAKSLFLANMSHELRTPLNAILGFSRLMQQGQEVPPELRENLDIINRSGEHLLELINAVLEIAKIESGKLQLEVAPFDLGAMVREVVELMRLRAQEKGLTLVLDQSSQFPRHIKGDEARLRQILVNLVGNAVKFTDRGGVTIRLGVENNAHQYLTIEVEDTGPGIASEDQPRLFEPFVQLGEELPGSGTGLGLSITRQFVQLMGGRIAVTSTPGQGACFKAQLPLEATGEGSRQIINQMARGEVIGLAPGQPPLRILIAEDQRDNQLLLAHLMNRIGLETKIAEDGAQCVEWFKSWHPDLIWMDRRMPVMDGVEATRRIRALPGGDRVKIVAVTASVFKEQQPEILAAQMDGLVGKPYRFNEIYDALAQQLNIAYRYREAESLNTPPVVAPTPDMLAGLPEALREQLRRALERLDSVAIHTAIAQVATLDPDLGQNLARLADGFDYPSILNALAGEPHHPPHHP